MSDFNNNEINKKTTTFSVTATWLILAIFILIVIGLFFGYSFFKENFELKNKELVLWFLFMLFAATITCVFGAVTSHASQKSEEKREKNIVQEIKSFLNEKTEEITSNVNVALKRSDLISGDQEEILNKLMNRCLETGEEIEKIRILAQDSSSFSEFFTAYFKDKPFKCKKLQILIHRSDISENHRIINDWMRLFNAKKNDIKTLRIRRKNEIKQRSIFGMIIDFDKVNHSIGMIGFYEPQEENSSNMLVPFNKRYGVLSEENSILEVINEFFNRYFNNAEKLKDESKETIY